MTKKILWNEILERLRASPACTGFRRKNSRWTRSFACGAESFWFHKINHTDDFDITCDCELVFDWLSRTPENIRGRLRMLELPGVFLGGDSGNISCGRQWRAHVDSSQSAVLAADQLCNQVTNVVLPYIKKYSAPLSALEVFSRDDAFARINSPFVLSRAIGALAMCVLLRDKQRFDHLRKYKLEYLLSVREKNVELFQKCASICEELLSEEG